MTRLHILAVAWLAGLALPGEPPAVAPPGATGDVVSGEIAPAVTQARPAVAFGPLTRGARGEPPPHPGSRAPRPDTNPLAPARHAAEASWQRARRVLLPDHAKPAALVRAGALSLTVSTPPPFQTV